VTRPGMSVVVIGVGNRFRCDDGVGPLVADRIAALGLCGVVVTETDGEPTRLLDAWEGATVAVVIDAVRSGTVPAGTVHRAEAPLPGGWRSDAPPPASSHGLGLGEAYALGAALGRLPARLIVLGVEGQTFAAGTELSDAVAGAVDGVVATVSAEIDGAGACA